MQLILIITCTKDLHYFLFLKEKKGNSCYYSGFPKLPQTFFSELVGTLSVGEKRKILCRLITTNKIINILLKRPV